MEDMFLLLLLGERRPEFEALKRISEEERAV